MTIASAAILALLAFDAPNAAARIVAAAQPPMERAVGETTTKQDNRDERTQQ